MLQPDGLQGNLRTNPEFSSELKSVEVTMSGASAAGAAAAGAAAARRRRQKAEEEMTLINTDPSGKVEYKIIRSATGSFKDTTWFRAVLDEEARAGWDLVEKLDNSRARLRRPTECRQGDAGLEQDPYRTQIGISEVALTLRIVASIFVGVVLLLSAVAGLVSLRH